MSLVGSMVMKGGIGETAGDGLPEHLSGKVSTRSFMEEFHKDLEGVTEEEEVGSDLEELLSIVSKREELIMFPGKEITVVEMRIAHRVFSVTLVARWLAGTKKEWREELSTTISQGWAMWALNDMFDLYPLAFSEQDLITILDRIDAIDVVIDASGVLKLIENISSYGSVDTSGRAQLSKIKVESLNA